MGWPLKGKFKLFQEQKGFSLFEVLVAVGILGLIGAGLLTALNTNYRAARTLDEQVMAVNLATTHIETIRESDYAANYPDAEYNQYKSVAHTECSNDDITYQTCTGNETLQKITVIVSQDGKPVLSMCTYKYRPLL